MKNSEELITQEVSPIAFDEGCKRTRGGLEVKSPNTKIGLRVRTALMAISIGTLSFFGIVVPLASRLPANLSGIETVRAELVVRRSAVDYVYDDYRERHTIGFLKGNIFGDVLWGTLGIILTGFVGISGFKSLSKRKKDVCRLAASLPGSTYAFLRDNARRAVDLEKHCTDFDRRLKAFVDGKAAFTGLEEQYEAAMAQFVEERLSLDAEATAYLADLRETVALDRRRLKFIDDCTRLAEIRQQLKSRVDAPLSTATRHVSQDIASLSLSQRLEHEQIEVGMPQHFLTVRP